MVVGDLSESTEIVVVGAGVGGYVAALRAAQYGKEVTLVEENPRAGGVCLLQGCIPSKAWIEAAHFFHRAQQATHFGVKCSGLEFSISEFQIWKRQLLDKLSQGIHQLLQARGVRWIQAQASFRDPHHLQLEGPSGLSSLQFQQAILATGSRPRPLPDFPWNGETVLSSREILELEKLPQSLLVIGGGYIGLELGSALADLGTQVTLVEATESLLPGMDEDLLRVLSQSLKKKAIEVRLQTLATSPKQHPNGLEVELKSSDGKITSKVFEKILVAVGRIPNFENLNLAAAGLTISPQGFLPTDAGCRTQQRHIFAVGDLTGGMMLAHKASREGQVAAANAAGRHEVFDQQVPAVVFTTPELAYVGWSEARARSHGLEISVGKFPFSALGRALILQEIEGLVKIVAEQKTQRILGVHIAGPRASDLIAEATLGMEMGALLEDLGATIHAHPTFPEALQEAAESALGWPLHRI